MDEGAISSIVSRATSDPISYGCELSGDKLKGSWMGDPWVGPTASEETVEAVVDPAAMVEVMNELEQQRDNLYAFTREQVISISM